MISKENMEMKVLKIGSAQGTCGHGLMMRLRLPHILCLSGTSMSCPQAQIWGSGMWMPLRTYLWHTTLWSEDRGAGDGGERLIWTCGLQWGRTQWYSLQVCIKFLVYFSLINVLEDISWSDWKPVKTDSVLIIRQRSWSRFSVSYKSVQSEKKVFSKVISLF